MALPGWLRARDRGDVAYTARAFGAGTFPSTGSITVTVEGATVNPGGPLGIDNDHDGFFAGQDCNDANARRTRPR